MIVIKNSIIPIKGFKALFFFGILFVRNDLKKGISYVDLNHEHIHSKQCIELLGVFFYLWYIIEYLIRLPMCDFDSHTAYRSICFEREAYKNQEDLEYPKKRKHFAWLKYVINK